MFDLLGTLALVLLLQAAPATEPASAAVAPSAAPAEAEKADTVEEVAEAADVAADEENPMVCKRESIAGSRLRARKTCRTVEGWKRYENDVRSEFGKAMNRHADTPR